MGNEDYGNIKESLANVIEDVNSLIEIGKIQVQDKEFKLEFFLGGDYKFPLNAMGMKAATSDNSCIWCKLQKKDKCDMSHSCSYFHDELARKLGTLTHKAWLPVPTIV